MGKIIRVNPDRAFAIIESESSPGNTYLGHISEFVGYIDCLSESYVNKIVKFITEEKEDGEIISKKAKNIIIQ